MPAILRVGVPALLLALQTSTSASDLWRCEQQPGGHWDCSSSAPADIQQTTPLAAPASTELPTVPAPQTDTPATPEAEPPAAVTAAEATPAADIDMQIPPAPAVTVPETGSVPATAAEPAARQTTRAKATQPDSTEQPTDPWALCPPVTYDRQVTRPIDGDTLDLQADNAVLSDKEIYTLKGNAIVQQGMQRLDADTIVYDQQQGRIDAQGGIHYRSPELVVDGSSATLYPEQDRGSLQDVIYALPDQHARGTAAAVRLDGRDRQHLDQATYTTCPEGNEDWLLTAREVDIDQAEGTGTAWHTKVAVKGLPVLYTPYLSFPIDDRRKSGLLIPKYGHTESTGVDISVPWYWNIAPNYDATFVPRYMSKRGAMLGGEFRYLSKHNRGTLRGEYLPSDNDLDDQDRSLVSINHRANLNPRLQASIVASNVSDDYYFRDFGTSLVQTSQTNLSRTGKLDYHGDWWDLGLMVRDYQTVDPDNSLVEKPYKQLPKLTFNAMPDRRLLGLQFSTVAELDYFTNSDGNRVKGTRLDLQPRVSYPVNRAAWYVEPAVSVRHTLYSLDNVATGNQDNPDRTTPIVSLDAGTFFERSSRWGETDFVQTLEPRLFYLYVPEKDQDDLPVFDTGDYDFNFWTLFRENRYTGPDRMGDANQLALAVTTRFLEPGSGMQRFSASLGSLVYFRDRKVTLPGEQPGTDSSSDLIGEMSLALARNWKADAELHWDPHESQTSRNDYRLQYRTGPRKLVNLAYRHRRDIQEQTDISFLWPLSRSWHMVGRWYYSLETREIIEAIAGIGYESCCWGAQLVGRSYIKNGEQDRVDEVFLQLELKGLSRIGTLVDDVLERGILDY
jgi:LPS-assembly protein